MATSGWMVVWSIKCQEMLNLMLISVSQSLLKCLVWSTTFSRLKPVNHLINQLQSDDQTGWNRTSRLIYQDVNEGGR